LGINFTASSNGSLQLVPVFPNIPSVTPFTQLSDASWALSAMANSSLVNQWIIAILEKLMIPIQAVRDCSVKLYGEVPCVQQGSGCISGQREAGFVMMLVYASGAVDRLLAGGSGPGSGRISDATYAEHCVLEGTLLAALQVGCLVLNVCF
jgi:hypothetical protein